MAAAGNGMSQEIAACPKVELHCHLDGVIDPEMARILRAEDPNFPIDPEEFERLYPVWGMEAFWGWFDYVAPAEKKTEYFCRIAQLHVERLKEQNVRYAEVMLPAGGFGLRRGIAEGLDRVVAVRRAVDAVENRQIQVEFLVGVGRTRTPEEQERLVGTLLALHQVGLIVGVALAGAELGYPVKPFAKTLARLREAGLGIEIHAGEWSGPDSVWDALRHGNPQRIGHGVALFRDPQLIARFQEQRIPIEFCLTSNVNTGSVARLEDHPVSRAKALGLNFSINTDDPGPFRCSMNSEYALLAKHFGFGPAEFNRIYQDSLAARFQPLLRVSV